MLMSKIVMTCPYGRIQKMYPNGHGINTYDQEVRDACLVKEKFKNVICEDVINLEYLDQKFHMDCLGKT